MPRYDFRCTACDNVFEVTRGLGETSAETCPVCSNTAKRVFTPVGVVFKGSGFHNTDYRTPDKSEIGADPASAPSAPACGAGCPECPATSS